MKDINIFFEEAKAGIVTVEFRKIDTDELRKMPCTLNRELSNNKVPEALNQNVSNDHFAVWCLDKKAWRSFRVNTVEQWYEGMPKEEI
jgi:hypothetical protein|tara:strand:+ start:855 stop:1118 length:264 start_codon:yes stop_codon:yes gene_type:complete